MVVDNEHWNWREDIDEETIRKCIAEGMSILQMQQTLGVCRETIEKRLILYDLEPGKGRKRGARQKRIPKEEIQALLDEGMKMKEMCNHFGVSHPTLSREMKRHGITPKRGRPRTSS